MFNLVPCYSKKWKPSPLNVKGVEGISQSGCIKNIFDHTEKG